MEEHLTYEQVKKIFEDRGCELLSEVFHNHLTPMDYRCSCGVISRASLYSFKTTHKCLVCESNRIMKVRYGEFHQPSFRMDNMRRMFAKQKCTLISKECFDFRVPLDFVCSCGRGGQVSFYNFIHGVRCNECNKRILKEVDNRKQNTKTAGVISLLDAFKKQKDLREKAIKDSENKSKQARDNLAFGQSFLVPK